MQQAALQNDSPTPESAAKLKLTELTATIEELPPLPSIVVKLLQASRDPNASVRDMVELIRLDPSLTAKVLRLCNSAYFGLPRKISSIQEALVYIGTDTLVNFILAGCLSAYYEQAQDGYGMVAGSLWRHSVGCAIAAQHLSPHADDLMRSEAFTAGLLHDVGKIILNAYVRDEFRKIKEIVRTRGLPFEQAEREVLGFSHTDAGAELARSWNLPDSLVDAIAHHQAPRDASTAPRLVSQVHLGNILCVSFGIGVGSEGLAYSFDPVSLENVQMEVNELYKRAIDVRTAYNKAEEMVRLVG